MEYGDQLEDILKTLNNLFSEDDFDILSSFFKAFAHPLRLKILLILYLAKDKKICVSNLVDLLGVSQPNVSQHLFILRSAGLVECERDKNFVCYTLRSHFAERIIELLLRERKCNIETDKGD
ncbi:MAG TPA: ArsR family transcriptional regulator [Aquificales bacterium]|nr:ArsR family transcriptional regulator [Aquificales bacterium]